MPPEKPERRKQRPQRRGPPQAKGPRFVVSEELFGFKQRLMKPDKKKEKKKKDQVPGYVQYCKQMAEKFPVKKSKLGDKYDEALTFVGWDLTLEEIESGVKGALAIGAVLALVMVIAGFLQFGLGEFEFLIYAGMGGMMMVIFPMLVQKYPLNAAENQKFIAMTEIPQIVGYLVMSMKLTPNLERAVSFAAEHGEGKLADSLRDILWRTNIGVYSTLEEGMDELAYSWGKYSPELKQALMSIRSSVLEPDDAQRFRILDGALKDVLTTIGNKMEDYAIQLKTPSMYMFYLGVLLPLILIIVLPIGSVFAELPFANVWVLFALYDVGLPIALYLFAKALLGKRPPTYKPPVIPDNYPGLPPKGTFRTGKGTYIPIMGLIMAILVLGIGASWFIHIAFDMTLENSLASLGYTMDIYTSNPAYYDELIKESIDTTPFFLIGGILLSISLAISAWMYYTAIYKRKVQEEIMQMESEFKDSTYLLASRLGQNKPIEDAMRYVSEFLPDSKLGNMFLKIRQNITLLGLTLEGAVFDELYGALRTVPSNLIQTSMRIIVDAVHLGVNVASRSVMALSAQLSAFDTINRKIEVELSEITATMKSMGTFIAPLVLGITTALQRVVIHTLSSFGDSATSQTKLPQGASGAFGSVDPGAFTQMFSSEALESAIGPTEFITILAVYVMFLVIIMIWFGARIQEGENVLNAKISIAKNLPIAIALFLAAAFFAKNLVAGGL